MPLAGATASVEPSHPTRIRLRPQAESPQSNRTPMTPANTPVTALSFSSMLRFGSFMIQSSHATEIPSPSETSNPSLEFHGRYTELDLSKPSSPAAFILTSKASNHFVAASSRVFPYGALSRRFGGGAREKRLKRPCHNVSRFC